MEQAGPAVVDLLQHGEMRAHALRMKAEALAETVRGLGYAAYCALFALGVLLLLAWVFWPRRRVLILRGWRDIDLPPPPPEAWRGGIGNRMADLVRFERAHAGFAGAILLLVLCAVGQQVTIDQERGFIADQDRKMRARLLRVKDSLTA